VLGEWQNGNDDVLQQSKSDIQHDKEVANLWYRCAPSETDSSLPMVLDVYCCGHRYLTSANQFVFYDYPERGRFYAALPFSLNPHSYANSYALASSFPHLNHPSNSTGNNSGNGHGDRHSNSNNGNNSSSSANPKDELEMVLSQINAARLILLHVCPSSSTKQAAASSSSSSSGSTQRGRKSNKKTSGLWQQMLWLAICVLTLPSFPLLCLYRAVSRFLQPVLTFVLPRFLFGAPIPLKSLFLTLLQAEFRIGESSQWMRLAQTLARMNGSDDTLSSSSSSTTTTTDTASKDNNDSSSSSRSVGRRKEEKGFVATPSYRAHQLRLYDSWLRAAIDSGLGMFACVWLYWYAPVLLVSLKTLHDFVLNDVLVAYVTWFMGEPSGFKLNPELTIWLGNAALFFLRLWATFMHAIQPLAPALMLTSCVCALCGMSVLLAFASDLFSLLTFHVYVLYVASAWIYKVQLSVLTSFWTLFQSKKYNVLRKRVDSHEYDVEQMLLGTLVFCATFFLFPTVCMYYVFFALARLAMLALQSILVGQLYVLSHFPFYSVLVWIVDRSQLPGGVFFSVLQSAGAQQGAARDKRTKGRGAAYVEMHSLPMGAGRVFYQLHEVFRLLTASYGAGQLWMTVSRGDVVPPPPREKLYAVGTKGACELPRWAQLWSLLWSSSKEKLD
jgi:hypothetical protein